MDLFGGHLGGLDAFRLNRRIWNERLLVCTLLGLQTFRNAKGDLCLPFHEELFIQEDSEREDNRRQVAVTESESEFETGIETISD